MDDLCAEILEKQKKERIIPIRLSEFETQQLSSIKGTRSFSEYCWTCTPLLIRYVIEEKKEPMCIYLDADMFFYSNPTVLLEEMNNAGKSVMFVPHNFAERLDGKEKEVGLFCVEFNPFTNDEGSLMVLDEWIHCCIESCSLDRDGKIFGDQKYLDALSKKYNNIHICKNKGAGMAPWNIDNFVLDGSVVRMKDGTECPPVFFHFQGVTFGETEIGIDIPQKKKCIDYHLVDWFYVPYLEKLKFKRDELTKEYSIDFGFSYSDRFKGDSLRKLIKNIIYHIPVLNRSPLFDRSVTYSL